MEAGTQGAAPPSLEPEPPVISAAGTVTSVPSAPPSMEPGPVAIVVKMFPRLSESFILNEILELRRRGMPFRLVSLMRPAGGINPAEAGDLARETFYLPVPSGASSAVDGGWKATLAAHRALLRACPGRYLRTLLLALRRMSPTAIQRFAQAGPLALFCRRERVSHLHAAFAHTPASVAFWAGCLSGLHYSFATHAKDLYLSKPASLRRKLDRARFVFTCTEANAVYLRSLGSATPIHVRHHGCDLKRFAPSLGEDGRESGPVRILAVGRLVPKKGFADLLEAAARLQAAGFDFELSIVGEGPLKGALQERSLILGLAGRVSFTGSLPPEAVRGQYARADLVVLPSVVLENGDRDGVPNVLVEALAMGVPVVSTRVSAIPELIRDGVTGLLVEPHAPAALAAAIRAVLENPEAARARADRARADVRERFDLHRNSELIATLLDRHRRPTRALYVTADFGVPVRGHKGASAHVRHIAHRLVQAGLETRVFTPAPGPEAPSGNEFAVPIDVISPPRWMDRMVDACRDERSRSLLRELRRLAYNVSLGRAVWEHLREARPDFVYERYSLCSLATGIMCRRRGVPWIVEVNAPLAEEEERYRTLMLKRVTRMLERWVLRRADRVLVVSHALRRWALEQGAHPDRVSVLANGYDGEIFHPSVDEDGARREWGWVADEIVVAFAGSLKAWHGGKLLLEAFARTLAEDPRLRLVFIGEGPEERFLRRKVRACGLDGVVRFTGAVPQDRVGAYLRAADILAAPYLPQDRFYFSPLKIMEYLAVGRPVVASRIGDIPQMIGPHAGRLVPPGDATALTEALRDLALDPATRQAMGRAAVAAARGQEWSARAAVILRKVREVQESKRRGGRGRGRAAGDTEVPAPRVGYVLKMFPRFSETFVMNEILELERSGMEVRVFSIKTPSGLHQEIADRVRALVTVLPRGAGLLHPRVALCHLRWLGRKPGAYLRAVWFVLGRRDVRALGKFAQAGYVAERCRHEGIGHLHAHFASGPARVAKLACMISGIPFSFTAHAKDLYWSGHHHEASHKMKKRVRLARFVVTVSRENERYIQSLGFKVKEGRIRTIHIGLRLEEFPFSLPSHRPPSPCPLILAVGRLVEKKGFHVLVAALARLRDRGIRFRCLIAGEGPEEEALRERIRLLGLEGQVRLLGAVPLDRLRRRYYTRARALAQPCVIAADGDRDGIPTVLVEAMAMGIPVISTRVSGIPEIIEDGTDGFLTDPGDELLLAARLHCLLFDDALADRLARAGRSRVETEFDLEKNAGYLRRLFLRSLHGWQLAPAGEPAESASDEEPAASGSFGDAGPPVPAEPRSVDAVHAAPVTA